MSGITAPSPRETARRWFQFRSARVRWPEWVAAVSSFVLLVALAGLTWYSFTRASGGTRVNAPIDLSAYSEDGWHGLSHAHWLILVTILVGFGLIFFQATRPAPALPATLSLFAMFLAGLSTIWLIVRVLIDPPGGRNFGGWLGLISAAVLTWAAYKSLRLEGIWRDDAPREIPTVPPAENPEPADPS